MILFSSALVSLLPGDYDARGRSAFGTVFQLCGLDERIAASQLLRAIRLLTDEAPARLSQDLTRSACAWPAVDPAAAALLQSFYTVRSERR